MRKIKIITPEVQMEAELNQTETAKAIWEKLPIEGRVNTWGEEIYFEIPVNKEKEEAVEVVKEGDIAYWPEGRCFCIFFASSSAKLPSPLRPRLDQPVPSTSWEDF